MASLVGGAPLGPALPVAVVQTALGVIVLGIVVLMFAAKKSEFPYFERPDALGRALRMHGVFTDGAAGEVVARLGGTT